MTRFVLLTLKFWYTVPKPKDDSSDISAGPCEVTCLLRGRKVQKVHLKGFKDIPQAAELMV